MKYDSQPKPAPLIDLIELVQLHQRLLTTLKKDTGNSAELVHLHQFLQTTLKKDNENS